MSAGALGRHILTEVAVHAGPSMTIVLTARTRSRPPRAVAGTRDDLLFGCQLRACAHQGGGSESMSVFARRSSLLDGLDSARLSPVGFLQLRLFVSGGRFFSSLLTRSE